MAIDNTDSHFRYFGKLLEDKIAEFGYFEDEDLLKRQKIQFDNLCDLEIRFRDTLKKHYWGEYIYKLFIKKMVSPKDQGGSGNILAARPYFRERQEVCIGPICNAIKTNNYKKIQQFHINSLFIRFTLKNKPWGSKSPLRKLAAAIAKQRDQLIISNMPLAISQARLFWQKAASRDPHQALSYMDLVQLASEGLMSVVDKYVPPFEGSFRSAIVQWCVGNFIEAFSSTMVHFYPKDKKKIYHANKNYRKVATIENEEERMEKLAELVNISIKSNHQTNGEEISKLLSSASTLSADATIATESDNSKITSSSYADKASADANTHPDNLVTDQEVYIRLHEAIQFLNPLERKLIKMMGVHC